MFVRRSIRVAVLPALVLCLTLAGCGGDEDIEPKMPETSSTTAASPTESFPTEPVEPTLPPEAEGDDAAAAEAFVRHYYDYVNYAQATGKTEGLSRLGLQDCAACNGGAEFIDSVYEEGNSLVGGVYRPTALSSEPVARGSGPSSFLVTAEVEHTRQKMLDKHGKVMRSRKAGKSTVTFLLVRDGPSWRIAKWDLA